MPTPRPFRFGVQARAAESGAAWREKARKAEDLGYATFLVPDHFARGLAPVAALAAAAGATHVLRVGSFVVDNDFRHPAVLAKDAATLDLLSDGRLELGLGAGWLPKPVQQPHPPILVGGGGRRVLSWAADHLV